MESLVRLGIIAVGLYLAAASVVLYLQLNRLRGAEQYVEHTQDVRHALQEVLVQALEAESTQRAFVIRKNEIYLTEHFAAVAALRSGIARVAELTRDNPLQAARAKDLSDLIEVRIAQMKASSTSCTTSTKLPRPRIFARAPCARPPPASATASNKCWGKRTGCLQNAPPLCKACCG